MIAAVGLAMGALSTVSSLVDQAASSVSAAVAPPSAPSFTPAAAAAVKKLAVPPPTINPGPPLAKFDRHSHAALLAAQETLNA